MLIAFIPNRPGRCEGAGVDTAFTTNTLFFIDPPDVAMLFIDVQRIRGTGFYTLGIDTLPALSHIQIVGELRERILQDLDAGPREILLSFMRQRACQHTGQTSLAFLGIHKEIAFRYRVGGHAVLDAGDSSGTDHDGQSSRHPEKLSAGKTKVLLIGSSLSVTHGDTSPPWKEVGFRPPDHFALRDRN
jgi:hypothetical protein